MKQTILVVQDLFSQVPFPSLHTCVISTGFLFILMWFYLLSAFAFTCLCLILPQLKYCSSPSYSHFCSVGVLSVFWQIQV